MVHLQSNVSRCRIPLSLLLFLVITPYIYFQTFYVLQYETFEDQAFLLSVVNSIIENEHDAQVLQHDIEENEEFLLMDTVGIQGKGEVLHSTSMIGSVEGKKETKRRTQHQLGEQEQPPTDILVPSDEPDSEPLKKILESIEPTNITHSADNGILLQNLTGSTCNPTSQIRILRTPAGSSHTKWTIQTYDQNGSKKTVGGDEVYIEFHHDEHNIHDKNIIGKDLKYPIAAAEVEDMGNGKYELEFVSTPVTMEKKDTMNFLNSHNENGIVMLPGGGKLTIHFVFTCGIGQIPPPLKDSWKNGGHSHTTYAMIPTDISPPIRVFEKPERVVDFAKFDNVIFIGDSVMQHFWG